MNVEFKLWKLEDMEVVGMDGVPVEEVYCWRARPIVKHNGLGRYAKFSPTSLTYSRQEIDEHKEQQRLCLFISSVPVVQDAMVLCVRQQMRDELLTEGMDDSFDRNNPFQWQSLLDYPYVWVGVANNTLVIQKTNGWSGILYNKGLKLLRQFIQSTDVLVGKQADKLFTMARQAAEDVHLRYTIEVANCLIYRLQNLHDAVDDTFDVVLSPNMLDLTRSEFNKAIDALEMNLK